MKINFHIHTDYSDGAVKPYQMVKIMKEKDFNCIALTDHDTVEGNIEAYKACKEFGISFVPGVEITSYLDNEIGLYDDSYKVHILGLGIDSLMLKNALQEVELKRMGYHKQIMLDFISNSTLSKCNLDLNNRVSCAQILYNIGAVDSLEKAMSVFRISPYAMSINETINTIHDAGGIAIWAHPFLLPKNGGYKITTQDIIKIYEYMAHQRIDGMEGFYLQFSQEEQNFIKNECDNYNAFCSTGTDFHADYDFEYELLDVCGCFDKKLLHALEISA